MAKVFSIKKTTTFALQPGAYVKVYGGVKLMRWVKVVRIEGLYEFSARELYWFERWYVRKFHPNCLRTIYGE